MYAARVQPATSEETIIKRKSQRGAVNRGVDSSVLLYCVVASTPHIRSIPFYSPLVQNVRIIERNFLLNQTPLHCSIMTSKSSTLNLYRRILFAAKRFPSKNRQRIYEEIRKEFRQNASLEPNSPEALACIKVAQDSYEHNLKPPINFSEDDKEWVYNTIETPMPPPPGWKKDVEEIAEESSIEKSQKQRKQVHSKQEEERRKI